MTTHEQMMIDVSYRVIADHLRCLTFALTDGAIPTNEGRGYVLRRILRRAVRYGRQYMNMHQPFLCDLVAPLANQMADAFPELRSAHGGRNVEHVVELIRDEEESFGKTLDRGITLFAMDAAFAIGRAYTKHNSLTLQGFAATVWEGEDENAALIGGTRALDFIEEPGGEIVTLKVTDLIAWLKERGLPLGQIRGKDAFKLHDTFGFPIDLTELMAKEQELTIDIGEYERLMEAAREKARASTNSYEESNDALRFVPGTSFSKCDDSPKYWDPPRCTATIRAWGGTPPHLSTDVARTGEPFHVSTNQTCFYAEQGGQVSDVGTITTKGGVIRVHKVMHRGDIITHYGVVESGQMEYGPGDCSMEVDLAHRIPTMQNHTSTHLLNWALREVLGDHVQQKGSLVDPEKTRFDFSHNKPVSAEELARIESLVNEKIEADLTVYTKEVDQAAAREINTLRAVFGEKYPERVRVVSIGAPIGGC